MAMKSRTPAARYRTHVEALRASSIEKVEIEQAELDGALTAADIVDTNT